MNNRLATITISMGLLADEIKYEEFEEEERHFFDELLQMHTDARDDMHELIKVLRAHIFATMLNPKGTE